MSVLIISALMKNNLIAYSHDIYALDSGYLRSQLVAVHLIVHQGRVALIDTGTFETLPYVFKALKNLGLNPNAVDYIILTHIHLDHAGGAGVMMEAFPQARLVVHPRGARHMAAPAQLMAGVEAVYGKARTRELYGNILPIPAARIIEAPENTIIHLAERPLLCLDTPGHARHHIVIYDAYSKGIFTGDMLGISYPELMVNGKPFLFPTTTPSQFDPMAMRQSVERILALQPETAYLTHFGRLANPQQYAPELLRHMDEFVNIAQTAFNKETQKVGADNTAQQTVASSISHALRHYLFTQVRLHGVALNDAALDALLGLDIDLNAQGLALWARLALPNTAA